MTKSTMIFVVGLLGCSLAVACKSSSTTSSTKGTGGSSTGSSGTSSGGSGFSCDFMVAGVHECAEYDGLTSEQNTAEKSACTAEGGTAGSSCTSTGRVGTCAQSASGLTYKTSYYSGTAATDEAGCKAAGGTWTAG
jgi:hypothetical protein